MGSIMSELNFEQELYGILERDSRYSRNAYLFAFQALEYTMKSFLQLDEDKRRHVSAQELLDGMKEYAIKHFGYMARYVWESWGIGSTDDWGNVVYNLIDAGLMKQNEEDSPELFSGVFDFEEVFERAWEFS